MVIIKYGAFLMEDLKFYSTEFTSRQAKDYNNQFAKRVSLRESFEYEPVGSTLPRNWIPGTGAYVIKELTAQDSVLKYLDVGTKYLECATAGSLSILCKQAYGTWEFDLYKGADLIRIHFISDRPETYINENGYMVILGDDESVALQRKDAGAVTRFASNVSYIANTTWYRIRVTRTLDGEFTMWIKGGTFGDVYTLVDTTGGSPANPEVDNVYTISNYFVLDLDVGDRISGISIKEGVIQ